MVFCPECGTENPDNAIYCQNCGFKIDYPQETVGDLSRNNRGTQLAYLEGTRFISDIEFTNKGIYEYKRSKISNKRTGKVIFYDINKISEIINAKLILFLYENKPIGLRYNSNKKNLGKYEEVLANPPYSQRLREIKEILCIDDGKTVWLILEDEGIKISKTSILTGWDKGGDFFRYEEITSIGIKKGLITATINITVPGKTIKIDGADNKSGEEFIQEAQNKMTEAKTKPKESNANSGTPISQMDEIKKAKDLLDAGAISQEQFEEIRDKYLKMI